MSTATLPRPTARPTGREAALEEELRHIRDLVFVRDLLHERGADADELAACDAVISEARAELAEQAKRASAPYAPAA